VQSRRDTNGTTYSSGITLGGVPVRRRAGGLEAFTGDVTSIVGNNARAI
jgi:hypothetical protein